MRITLAQLNATVGDLGGNAQKALAAYREAMSAGSQLLVLPELFLTGYPPEDLLLLPSFLTDCQKQVRTLAKDVGAVPMLIGAPVLTRGKLFNAALLLQDGKVAATAKKMRLPNYGPFDERRYFEPGKRACLVEVGGCTLGVSICEDLWFAGSPCDAFAAAGVDAILNLSASPYHRSKHHLRRQVFGDRARESGKPVLVCNLVGGQDELIFDGRSFALLPDGSLFSAAPGFAESLLHIDLDGVGGGKNVEAESTAGPVEKEVADALCLALTDYVRKNRFPGVLIGMSGGIDSALVGALAVRALGAESVHAISMPSRFNSPGTRSDARRLCDNLGVDFREISIEPVFRETLATLEPYLGDREAWGLTAENMQARARGQLLMSLSNRFGWLVVATGNKSELAMGYATLYGDMVGGFALIKDLTKAWVFRLTRYLRESEKMDIPESILTRPPSAELRENQTDQDTLPPYEVLDRILEAYIEGNQGMTDIVAGGEDPAVVKRILQTVDRNEFKRRQAAPGPRITERVFGKDRRMPITQKWERK